MAKPKRAAPKKPKGLSGKQEAFAREYAADFNASAAYRRAGYTVSSDTVARVEGHRLLANPNIAAAVAAFQARAAELAGVGAVRVLRELARLGFSDARKLFGPGGPLLPVAEWDDDTAAAVASVETFEEYEGQGESRRLVGHTRKVKLWSKTEALSKLGAHLALFKEVRKVIGNGPGGEIPLKVTHDASGIEPYRAVFALFAKSVLDGVRDGTVRPDGTLQPVDTPDAVAQAGPVPRP